MSNSILIMDGEAMMRALRRIAHEILEHNPDPDGFSLVGIPSRGVELARRAVLKALWIARKRRR